MQNGRLGLTFTGQVITIHAVSDHISRFRLRTAMADRDWGFAISSQPNKNN
jgi:hypothetical protein